MIRSLKIKFITLSMTLLFLLLALIVTGMNLMNYNSVIQETDQLLALLCQNRGAFPDFMQEPGRPLPNNMSPEVPYESRYFSVLLNPSGDTMLIDTSHVVSIDSSTALEYAQNALKKNTTYGFIDNYRFALQTEDLGIRITFLDCGRKLDALHTFLFTSILMSVIGFIVVFIILLVAAEKILKPISESYAKQKRFITDAGHEIKTPLTIIKANVDVLAMDFGDNECLSDIQQQVDRLKSLTNDLVMLARMEEAENHIQKIEFPISDVLTDLLAPFQTLAGQQDIDFSYNIQPMLSFVGNAKSIEQLVCILMDNAFKYSPKGGRVTFSMERQGKMLNLSVYNTTSEQISKEQLNHVFDRFYRTDASRNSSTGGHGIGLSTAQAIVHAHNGKIQASTVDGFSFQISVNLPINQK